MIYRLVWLNQAWRRMIWRQTLCFWIPWGLVVGGIMPRLGAREDMQSFMLTGPFMMTPVMLLLWADVARRASLFEAALPIPARDLFAARLLMLLGFIWIPLLATASAYYVARGTPPSFEIVRIVTAGAVATALVLVFLSARLQEFGTPRWVGILLFLAVVSAGPLILLHSTVAALAICAGLIAALLWWDLAHMPKAFHVAPKEATSTERPASQGVAWTMPVWWPVLRCMFSWTPMSCLFNSLLWLALGFQSGIWYWAPLWLGGLAVNSWISMRCVWALPVDRRKVFALVLLPPMLLGAGTQMFGPFAIIRSVGFVALALLSASVSLGTSDRKRLNSGLRLMAVPYMFLILLLPALTLIADSYHGKRFGGQSYTAWQLTAHLDGVLPRDPVILIATSLVALGALYWLVQRQFEGLDCLPPAQNRISPAGYSPTAGA